jgi:hypothetical protein
VAFPPSIFKRDDGDAVDVLFQLNHRRQHRVNMLFGLDLHQVESMIDRVELLTRAVDGFARPDL